MTEPRPTLFGLMAEFTTAEALIAAAHKTREAGFKKVDGYSPFPIEGLTEAMGYPRSRLPRAVLAAGVIGATIGLVMQYWMNGVDYPINISGKPLFSLPAFVPITFEMTILLASFTAAIGMMVANHLPSPYHPVFNVDEFTRASRDRFFLFIDATDPSFEREKTEKFLKALQPEDVHEVDA